MSAPVDVLAVLRQMHANSSHFRNGLPVLADYHKGEAARELVAIAAVAELIGAVSAERAVGHRKYSEIAEARKRTDAALARVKGGAA